jgi:hypothetical protein
LNFRFKDDKQLTDVANVKISSKLDAESGLVLALSVDNLAMSDAGELKAVAQNAAGTATTTARLTVNSK